MMTSAISADNYLGSAMMTSVVMSSQSAVDKKRKSWISDYDFISDVITNSSELQWNQSMTQQLKIQPVAKQLTYSMKIYESWMSTAEPNSNIEDDKKPAKERTQGQFPVGTLQNIFQTGRICVQRIEFEQRLFGGEELKEEDDDCAMIS
ncbi:scarecrow-like protein 34 [Dorcoceras hygrometricum]|uniref:Scarecrow-like protein 34 n=1 Tax=Dorcoceras hygrometricum TaxID=472368 RepID=A0A2Z7CA09_9LAMI|nr:scarecrow-like protein 34 [Dorcoceras hygrometricum]